ncbi:hypothetical protein SAMN04487949_1701 [Halogranum gelatinilyticum]|uniref:Uncharacterized protein n=1 Tax=Halogranum gelatinilyticum TaxID=660521 RepID=A0A1G9TB43_9EURY|nr:hypothetical protein [Halogranum gelatinilyticum]SDM44923.1 hypothetical protein SAMN04487949_1701 [Halogranum gelatinilyticum]
MTVTNNPAGLFVIFVFLGAVVGSVLFVAAAFLLERRVRPFSRALTYVGAGVGVLAAALVVAASFLALDVGIVVGVIVVGAAGILWVLPFGLARWVLVRRGLDGQRALRYAAVGLPVALVTSLFVVFGDFQRYNITFLTGTEAVVAWTVLALVVFLGPTAVALGVAKLRT